MIYDLNAWGKYVPAIIIVSFSSSKCLFPYFLTSSNHQTFQKFSHVSVFHGVWVPTFTTDVIYYSKYFLYILKYVCRGSSRLQAISPVRWNEPTVSDSD